MGVVIVDLETVYMSTQLFFNWVLLNRFKAENMTVLQSAVRLA